MRALIAILLLVPLISCNQNNKKVEKTKDLYSKYYPKGKKNKLNSKEQRILNYARQLRSRPVPLRYLNDFTNTIAFGRDMPVYNPRKVEMRILDDYFSLQRRFNLRTIYGNDHPIDWSGVSFGMDNDEKIIIYINGDDWREYNDDEKRLLIFHELAHDFLNARHVNDRCHFMYPRIPSQCQITYLDKKLQ